MADASDQLSYCAEQIRANDHDRFLTCLFAPAGAREDLFALYAFNLEIAKVAEVVSEPMAGQIRIQWWREALDGLYSGAPRKHQVAEPLSAAIRRHDLSRDLFERLLDARERDLDTDPPATLEDLEGYATETSATLVELACEVLGVRDEASRTAARHVGIAHALVGLARAVPFHATQRRMMLPGNLAWEYELDPHDLFELRQPAAVRPVVREMATRAGEHLGKAKAARPPRKAVPALLPATLTRRYLSLLDAHDHDVFAPKVQTPPPGRPWRLLWANVRGRF
ncbi:phytoene/squalene synthase family protein [Rhodovibrio salinarum]|uniref:Squalene/phytoene synthase family protein n=1 Tax=Rhodovibrio salinarum TaxID=1087 RepID=A0A934QJT8_9PROT|nr:phytoene/squalene synthase family protein [Rhodovibrio salinarum]MBK1697755.1 squalene/phytoene synthase family protein [Rhodovibrio salinarum]